MNQPTNTNKKSRISVRDKHFAIAWSLQDTAKIEEYTKRLASMYGKPELEAEYTRLADQMLGLINKRDNDHHSATADLAGHDWLKVEPIDAHIGEDMCTFQGLNKLLKIYIGTASGVFKWTAYSEAPGVPTPYAAALTVEVGTRQDSTTTGFHDVKGSSIRVFSSYASSTATVNMYQIGIFDASTSGMMLAIHDFGGVPFAHTVNAESFSLGMVIDLVPFGDV